MGGGSQPSLASGRGGAHQSVEELGKVLDGLLEENSEPKKWFIILNGLIISGRCMLVSELGSLRRGKAKAQKILDLPSFHWLLRWRTGLEIETTYLLIENRLNSALRLDQEFWS